jgi:hypothetical protein
VFGFSIFVATVYLLASNQIKKWPEVGLLMAIFYSFCGVITFKYLANAHQSFGSMADLMIYLLGGGCILLCGVLTLLLTNRALFKFSLSTRFGGLLTVFIVAYLLTELYQKEQLQQAAPNIEESLDPVNHDIEARNKMLEEGIDPNSKR